jgi:transcriptional regulator with XRE-family HTH domain
MLADILHFTAMDEAPNRIRELRLEAGLSQQALGDKVGVSKMTISDLERGEMRLDLDYMRRIAYALGVLPADLMPARDNPLALSIHEHRLVEQYRTGDENQREQLHKVADVLIPFRHEPVAPPPRRQRA